VVVSTTWRSVVLNSNAIPRPAVLAVETVPAPEELSCSTRPAYVLDQDIAFHPAFENIQYNGPAIPHDALQRRLPRGVSAMHRNQLQRSLDMSQFAYATSPPVEALEMDALYLPQRQNYTLLVSAKDGVRMGHVAHALRKANLLLYPNDPFCVARVTFVEGMWKVT
jgi:hypothetical protein